MTSAGHNLVPMDAPADERRLSDAPSAFVGLISDTHGLLRPEAVAALQGSRLILHAGDVGHGRILAELARIAPVTAVRGNTDVGEMRRLPEREVVDVGGGVRVCVIHILDDLDLDPAAAGCAAVIYGHTHEPRVERRGGVWYVNPGSAGPRRFSLPVTVARMYVEPGGVRTEIVELTAPRAP
jgi:putative phosphoesterase